MQPTRAAPRPVAYQHQRSQLPFREIDRRTNRLARGIADLHQQSREPIRGSHMHESIIEQRCGDATDDRLPLCRQHGSDAGRCRFRPARARSGSAITRLELRESSGSRTCSWLLRLARRRDRESSSPSAVSPGRAGQGHTRFRRSHPPVTAAWPPFDPTAPRAVGATARSQPAGAPVPRDRPLWRPGRRIRC